MKNEKFGHGGRREGAGRPNLSGLPAHLKRPKIKTRQPVLITVRLAKGIPTFKVKHVRTSLRKALLKAQAKGLRVAKYAIEPQALYFLMKPYENFHIEKCMKSLCTSFAKRMNLKLNRNSEKQGPVFKGRYDLKTLQSSRDLKAALKHFTKKPGPDFKALDSLLIEPQNLAV